MIDLELQQARHAKWRIGPNARPMRTLEDAILFIEEVGFCLMYPMKPPVLCPTFMGAYVGDDSKLPTWQNAFADPRALEATELMVRLLRSKHAYEANVFGDTNFLVSASAFPYFYALIGDKNPRGDPQKLSNNKHTPLEKDIVSVVHKHGPVTKQQMRELLGGGISEVALERAIVGLWSELKVIRVDYKPGEGAYWDALYRWSPEAVKQGVELSTLEALTALVSKYVDGVVAAEETEIVEFFGHFTARAKTQDAIHALQAAREFDTVSIAGRKMVQLMPTPEEKLAVAEAAAAEVKIKPLPRKPKVQKVVRRAPEPQKAEAPEPEVPKTARQKPIFKRPGSGK